MRPDQTEKCITKKRKLPPRPHNKQTPRALGPSKQHAVKNLGRKGHQGASNAGKGIDGRGHHSPDRGQHRPSGHHGSIGGSRGDSILGEKPTDRRRKLRQKAPRENAIGDGNVGGGGGGRGRANASHGTKPDFVVEKCLAEPGQKEQGGPKHQGQGDPLAAFVAYLYKCWVCGTTFDLRRGGGGDEGREQQHELTFATPLCMSLLFDTR